MTAITFQDIIGQEKAKLLLKTAATRGALSHAYLFRGPDGVGKKKTALAMAAYINCTGQAHGDGCGACPSCRRFAAGAHPDLLHVLPDGAAIKINQVREIQRILTFPPFEAKTRVTILEDVHTMRREAANSLLKTLEEPPENNLLILTADESGDLLPTIVSRCQQIPFYGLTSEQVVQHLVSTQNLSPENGASIAAVAEGSLGRAALFLDHHMLDLRREVIENLVTLSKNDPETVEKMLLLAEKAAALKEGLNDLLGLIKTWLRDILVLHAGNMQSLVNSRDMADRLSAGMKKWGMADIFSRLSSIEQAEKELNRNCNRTLVCEVLFWELV